jgi:hypothetical protein
VLVRQVLGAISQFEKASLVAKLKAARGPQAGSNGQVRGHAVARRDAPRGGRARAQAASHPLGATKGLDTIPSVKQGSLIHPTKWPLWTLCWLTAPRIVGPVRWGLLCLLR